MKTYLLVFLAISTSTVTALAQPGPDEDRGQRRRRGRDPAERMERVLKRLAEDLVLDAEQRAQLDEIAGPYRERMREMSQRRSEVREAMRNGDEDLAAELRARMREDGGPWASMSEMVNKVEPILSEEQLERFSEMRAEMEERYEDRARRFEDREHYRQMARELPDELDMDEGQREKYGEFLSSWREQFRTRMRETGPLREQMRAAREANDEERIAELRSEFDKMRPDPEKMHAEFFSGVQNLLRDEQKKTLALYRARFEAGDGDGQTHAEDVRVVLAAARRARLSPDQKEDLRAIRQEAVQASREIRRQDRQGQALLAATIKDKVVRMLDAEQAERYEREIERLRRRSRGR